MPDTHVSHQKHQTTNRVKAALAGKMGDRPPVGFWAHNFTREITPESLAQETVRVVQRYNWDFAKIQNRATGFAEDWGLRVRFSSHPHKLHDVLEVPIRDAADLRKIKPLDPYKGVLGEQITALKMVRNTLDPDIPVIQTIFHPAMVLQYLLDPSPANHGRCLRELLTEHPQPAREALSAIKETYANFATAAIESGADGIFFSIKAAGQGHLPLDQYKAFCLADDREILQAAQAGWFNILHLCGKGVYFDVIPDLPVHVINYEVMPEHLGLKEVRDRFGRAVMGGVSPKPYIATMSPAEVAGEVTKALDDTSGLGMFVAPGCSVSPNTPAETLLAVHKAISDWVAEAPR